MQNKTSPNKSANLTKPDFARSNFGGCEARPAARLSNPQPICLSSNKPRGPIHIEVKNKTSLNKKGTENLAEPDFARSSRVRGPLAPHHRASNASPCQHRPPCPVRWSSFPPISPGPETPADAPRPLTSNAQVRRTTQCSERSDLQLRRLARLAPPECSGGDAKADPRDFFRFVTSSTRFVTPIHSEDRNKCLKNEKPKTKERKRQKPKYEYRPPAQQVSIGKPQVRKTNAAIIQACVALAAPPFPNPQPIRLSSNKARGPIPNEDSNKCLKNKKTKR